MKKNNKLNCNVKVVMTPSSKEFVTPLTLSTVSKNDVHSEFSTKKMGTLPGTIMSSFLNGQISL